MTTSFKVALNKTKIVKEGEEVGIKKLVFKIEAIRLQFTYFSSLPFFPANSTYKISIFGYFCLFSFTLLLGLSVLCLTLMTI